MKFLPSNPFCDALGNDEVRKVVTKLSDEHKHEEILPKLKEMEEEESAKAKKGGMFGWLFKGKEKTSDKASDKASEKEKEKEKEKEREREKEREKEEKKRREKDKKAKSGAEEHHHRTHTHSKSGGHTDPVSHEKSSKCESEPKSDDLHEPMSAVEIESPAQRKNSEHNAHTSPAAQAEPSPPVQQRAPGRGLPFNPQFTQLEAEMRREYNFQSTTNRGFNASEETAGNQAAPKDDDFDAIFRQFLSGGGGQQ